MQFTLEQLNSLNKNTLMESLGIEYTEIGQGIVTATMPVDHRTKQPAGILHGGASIALAETIAGLGSWLLVDPAKSEVRGAQLTANHVRACASKLVFAKATIVHKGNNTHLWNVDVFDESEQLVSTIRITNFIVAR